MRPITAEVSAVPNMTEPMPTHCESDAGALKDAGVNAVIPDRVIAAVDPVEPQRNLFRGGGSEHSPSQSDEACQQTSEPRHHGQPPLRSLQFVCAQCWCARWEACHGMAMRSSISIK